jgi:hypothetical protein
MAVLKINGKPKDPVFAHAYIYKSRIVLLNVKTFVLKLAQGVSMMTEFSSLLECFIRVHISKRMQVNSSELRQLLLLKKLFTKAPCAWQGGRHKPKELFKSRRVYILSARAARWFICNTKIPNLVHFSST